MESNIKKILLVCAAGISTSLLINKMKTAAKNTEVEIEIFALPIFECVSVVDLVDVVLLGPQLKYKKPQVDLMVNGRVPVEVINTKDFGTLNGKAVLERAIELIKV